MAGAIDKKINETRQQLVDSPVTHIDARAAILSDIALSREFAHTFLQALCKAHTGGKNEAGSTTTMSTHTICQALAKQRMICYGAHTISTTSKKFSLPNYETVNGALTLTEANTSFFGYVCTDLDEKNTITLQNTAGTQTIDGNTFSTQITDYYMVRSRVSGELESTSGNLQAYVTPQDPDVDFGNTIAWGSSVAGEESANTWNYHWAKANIASTTVQNSGTVNQLNVLTLADHLTQGSNTNYTPVGPGFNNKFYLKKHTDSMNTFTITGTTTTGSVEVSSISDADVLKIKIGDVISGTGISGAPVIDAVQEDKNQLRMANTAAANGTVTITVNSVPFGHAAHDIFCQVEVSAEGLVANTTWTPVGDDAGGYATGSEDDLCVANTTQFISLLNFFDPAQAGSNDLIKGASAAYSSIGKEYEGGSATTDKGYAADIEINPIKPSNQGTTKAFTLKEGEMTGTQPDGLGDQDVYVGRFVSWMKDKTTTTSSSSTWPTSIPDPEYRYITDSAEKFFYAPARSATYTTGNDTVAGESMPGNGAAPGEVEPRAVLPRTGMSTVTDRVITNDDTGGWGGNTATTTVPADDAFTYGALSGGGYGPQNSGTGGIAGSGDRTGSIGSWYKLESNNFITLNRTMVTIDVTTTSSGTTYTLSYANQLVGPFACYYNFVRQHVSGTDDSTDYAFVKATASALTAVDNFRDPIVTGAQAGGSGISDSAFDGRAADFTANTVTAEAALTAANNKFAASGRAAHPEGGTGVLGTTLATGSAVNFASFTHSSVTYNGVTEWETLKTSAEALTDACDKRVVEIDARIGVPTYANSTHASGVTPSTRGNPPCIRVKAIPASNTTNGFVPYGRSIYNNVNLLLGGDVDLLGKLIKDIESLGDLVDLIKTARNKYEIFNGRDKEYS
jgi:hypothetical protein